MLFVICFYKKKKQKIKKKLQKNDSFNGNCVSHILPKK